MGEKSAYPRRRRRCGEEGRKFNSQNGDETQFGREKGIYTNKKEGEPDVVTYPGKGKTGPLNGRGKTCKTLLEEKKTRKKRRTGKEVDSVPFPSGGGGGKKASQKPWK